MVRRDMLASIAAFPAMRTLLLVWQCNPSPSGHWRLMFFPCQIAIYAHTGYNNPINPVRHGERGLRSNPLYGCLDCFGGKSPLAMT